MEHRRHRAQRRVSFAQRMVAIFSVQTAETLVPSWAGRPKEEVLPVLKQLRFLKTTSQHEQMRRPELYRRGDLS